jgi:hypothetical protein
LPIVSQWTRRIIDAMQQSPEQVPKPSTENRQNSVAVNAALFVVTGSSAAFILSEVIVLTIWYGMYSGPPYSKVFTSFSYLAIYVGIPLALALFALSIFCATLCLMRKRHGRSVAVCILAVGLTFASMIGLNSWYNRYVPEFRSTSSK